MAKKDGKNTDRERIPERVVHARGFVCYGEFEATGHIGIRSATVGA